MKKITLLLGLLVASISALFAQVPLASEDVMLQGFYWNSYQNNYGTTKWADLNKQVDEISSSFDLLWLPPSAESGGGTGYHPKKWSNQTSIWGVATQLKEWIAAFKEKETRQAFGASALSFRTLAHMENLNYGQVQNLYVETMKPLKQDIVVQVITTQVMKP